VTSRIRLIGAIAVSIIVTVSFGLVLTLYLTRAAGVPPSDTLTVMLGVLAKSAGDVVGYWLGSSSGSHAKDDARDEMLLAQRGTH
jgi:predicted Na+-dependent transporter